MFSVDGRRSQSTAAASALSSLFHARGAVTEKAVSLIHQRVRGTSKLPRVKVHSEHLAGTVHWRLMSVGPRCTVVCVRATPCGTANITCTGFSVIGNNQCNSWSSGVTQLCSLRSRTGHATALRTRRNTATVETGRPPSTVLQY